MIAAATMRTTGRSGWARCKGGVIRRPAVAIEIGECSSNNEYPNASLTYTGRPSRRYGESGGMTSSGFDQFALLEHVQKALGQR